MSAQRIAEFDVWREGYAGAVVRVYIAGTTTLAAIFTDEALTEPADNPQTLSSLAIADRTYGKFGSPLYTTSAYYLDIDSTDQTGTQRLPLTTLDGQDASGAEVMATGSSQSRVLRDILARIVHAEDYGLIGSSAATNNTTITAAIGAAAALGGGIVILPDGIIPATGLTIPEEVILQGQGHDVTTLQIDTLDDCITFSGDGAGLARLTLDGIDLGTGSVGVFSKANNNTVFDDVRIKRFETGFHLKGARDSHWDRLHIDNCATGAKLHGDLDAGGGADGDEFRGNVWRAGSVTNCTTAGIHLSFEDAKCWKNTFDGISFEDNTGTAVLWNGAQYTGFPRCRWTGNTVNFAVADDSNTDKHPDNQTIGLHMPDVLLNGGTFTLTGLCQDVVLERPRLENVDFTLTLPGNAILIKDGTEDADVTIAGDGTKYTRIRSIDRGASSGITNDATATKVWSIALEPGQRVFLVGRVLGNQRNGVSSGEYYIAVSARRPGSALAYDTQSVNFTVGDVLTGTTSGATARIIADTDGGTTGTLTLRDITPGNGGDFQDNELITDGAGGSATVNGALVAANAALLGSVTDLRAVREDVAGWAAAFVANGPEIELQCTGAASTTVEWLCDVEVTAT